MARTSTGRSRIIRRHELTPGTFVTVHGRTEYSRLLTPIDGEELARDKARRIQAGMKPITEPYTIVQITDARVQPSDPGGIMTKEEQYIDQQLYQRIADGPGAPWHFAAINRDASVPNRFFMARPDTPAGIGQIVPEHELADGMDVILVLRISEPRVPDQKGIVLHAVILQEPGRYRDDAQCTPTSVPAAAAPAANAAKRD